MTKNVNAYFYVYILGFTAHYLLRESVLKRKQLSANIKTVVFITVYLVNLSKIENFVQIRTCQIKNLNSSSDMNKENVSSDLYTFIS